MKGIHANELTARKKTWVLIGGGSVWDLRKAAPLNTICKADALHTVTAYDTI